jgi:glucosamine-6-phosphate deaminase
MPPASEFHRDGATVRVYRNAAELGAAAGEEGAAAIARRIGETGRARIIVATGNSQLHTVAALAASPRVDWRAVEVFHMDEYAGMHASHPASFRRWIKERLADAVRPRAVHYLNGDAPDLDAECARYSELLAAAPIDVCFLGFGENGHIAFNDPHEADFADPRRVRRATLDDKCRLQQVGEGHFANLDAVPHEALTLTCTALVSARRMICSVPERRKAEAVRAALEGPVSEACPGSLLRTHSAAAIYLDTESASLL